MEKDLINKKLEEIAKKHSLELLLIFGSEASGKTIKFSDCDFGFRAKKKKDITERGRLEDDLQALYKNKEIDLADLDEVSPLMKYEILKNHKILFQVSGGYSDYFVRTLQEYFGSKRLFDLQELLVAKKIKMLKDSL